MHGATLPVRPRGIGTHRLSDEERWREASERTCALPEVRRPLRILARETGELHDARELFSGRLPVLPVAALERRPAPLRRSRRALTHSSRNERPTNASRRGSVMEDDSHHGTRRTPSSAPTPRRAPAAPPRKTVVSTARRTAPLTGTGALPERLGSPGTAKVPQAIAAARGTAIAANQPAAPEPARHRAPTPSATRDAISRAKRSTSWPGAIDGGTGCARGSVHLRSPRRASRKIRG